MGSSNTVASAGRRAPDFFIVGQPKAGTTALYKMLRRHPEIFMPDLKEPLFMANDMRDRFRAPGKGEQITSLDRYLDLFSPARPDQLIGEASTLYLFSHTAATAIAELNPDARIIAIFREPTSFLYSLFLQHRQDHQEDQRDLRRALAMEDDRVRGRNVPRRAYRPQDLRYSEHLRYTDQLRRYYSVFSPKQVLVLLYDDYRRDNVATMRRVLQFLDVADELPMDSTEANPTVWVRSQALDDAVHRFSVGRGPFSRAAKAGVKALLPRAVRQQLLQNVRSKLVLSRPPGPDPELMVELRSSVKPEVERFGEYLGRDVVTLWGYNDV